MSFEFEIRSLTLANSTSKASGVLKLNQDTFSAVSGGHKKGALPYGPYRVKTREVLTNEQINAGKNEKLKRACTVERTTYYIPIEFLGDSSRKGLAIHPDGNVPGTEGCIGLLGADATRFWKCWLKIPLASRPTSLLVTSKVGGKASVTR